MIEEVRGVVPNRPRSRPARASHRGGVYGRVLDALGEAVVNGRYTVGETLNTDTLSEQLRASRSVLREVVRTLASMGLVDSLPSRGTRVLPHSEWDHLNPHLIRWRGTGPNWRQQQLELLELRLGVEPEAAYLAVKRGRIKTVILDLAEELDRCLRESDIRGFFVADAEFHRTILTASGNQVLAQLGDTIAAVIEAREFESVIEHRNPLVRTAIEQHGLLAKAIADADAEQARARARGIVLATLHELGDRTQEAGSKGS